MTTAKKARHRALAYGTRLILAATFVYAYGCSGSNTGPGGSGYNTGPGSGGNAYGNTTSIDMIGTSFSPATDTVAVGATVTWTNRSDLTHTVTANDGSFASAAMNNGDTFQHTYAAAGVYPYYCQFHGNPTAGMRGVVVVR